jgi:hypothetical protein
MIGGGQSEYSLPVGEADGGSFNLDLLFGYDFGLLALQGEVLFSTGGGAYEFQYDAGGGYLLWKHINFYMTTLRIPVLLKLDLHWKRIMFQPQAGFYLNFGLGDLSYEDNDNSYYGPSLGSGDLEYSSPLFGAMLGGAFGVRIGRGYLFLDIRYAVDLGKTEVKSEGIKFERGTAMVNLGYQYYFRSKQ